MVMVVVCYAHAMVMFQYAMVMPYRGLSMLCSCSNVYTMLKFVFDSVWIAFSQECAVWRLVALALVLFRMVLCMYIYICIMCIRVYCAAVQLPCCTHQTYAYAYLTELIPAAPSKQHTPTTPSKHMHLLIGTNIYVLHQANINTLT